MQFTAKKAFRYSGKQFEVGNCLDIDPTEHNAKANIRFLLVTGRVEELITGPVRRAHVEAPMSSEIAGSVAVSSEGAFDDMTDENLRDFIEKRDGDRPHFRLGRPKLLALARKAADPEPRAGAYLHRAMRAEGAE